MKTLNNEDSFIKISDKLTDSLSKLYKVGGLGLVFIFLGTLILIFAFFSDNSFSTPMFIIGSLLLLVSFILFIFVQFDGLFKTRKALNENKEAVDEIQDLALTLTKLTYNTQSYCFKNIDEIKKTIDSLLPIVRPLLGIGGQGVALRIEDISSGIVDYSVTIEKVILETKDALENGDISVISKYSQQLEDLNEKLQVALKNE